MKEIIVLTLMLFSFFAFAQEKSPDLKKGQGKRYTAIFHDGKGAEYSVYLADFKTDHFYVECQVKVLDGITPFRFWQQYEWKMLKNYNVELISGYVFSAEMRVPQKFSQKDFSPDVGVPLTQAFFLPFTTTEMLNRRTKKDFELFQKDNIKSRPTIINPAKAEALDEKGKEILSYPYSCL